MRTALCLLTVLLALTLAPVVAPACSCIRPPDPCSRLKPKEGSGEYTAIAFVGQVIEGNSSRPPSRRARIRVLTPLAGIPEGTLELETGGGVFSSCDVYFSAGERMVIFGQIHNDEPSFFSTITCDGSFPVEGNEPLAQALIDAVAGKPPTLVLDVSMGLLDQEGNYQLATGVAFRAQNGVYTRTANTDANGLVAFADLEPGKWTVQALDEQWAFGPMYSQGYTADIQNGCVSERLEIYPNGKISGTVRDAQGIPAPGIPVQLVGQAPSYPSGALMAEQQTDAQGNYRFTGLPPGNYQVGININRWSPPQPWTPVFYRRTATARRPTTLELARLASIDNINLLLTKKRQPGTLRIEAILEDGTPAKDFLVELQDAIGRNIDNYADRITRSESTNTFTLPVFIGETYHLKVQATRWEKLSNDSLRPIGQEEAELKSLSITQPETTVTLKLRFRPQ